MAIRPFTPFPPPPLKFRTVGFPQYGFKRAASSDLHGSRHLYAATVAISPLRVLFRSRTCVRRHSQVQTQLARPVALGSASGCSVRRPPRLLWPHPSFCRPRRIYELMPAVARPAEGPQFTLPELDAVPPSLLRWLQDADRRACAPDWAFTHPVGVRQPLAPHTGLRVVCFTKLQRSLNAAARNLACPASGRDVYDRACVRQIALSHVGYDYMNSRLIHGRTLIGCSDSLMGCTQDEQDGQDVEENSLI